MKRKILGIFVCMLLIAAAVLSAAGTMDEKTITSTGAIESVPVLEFTNIEGGLLSFSVELTNSGEGTTGNIEWSMCVSGGLYDIPFIKKFLVPESMTYGEIDSLGHDESGTIKIGPVMLALGRFNVFFDCRYTITNLSKCDGCEADITVVQEYVDQGRLIFHTFPENQQPVKEWRVIDDANVSYLPNGEWVELTYISPTGINKMHNVRVYDPDSQKTEFLGACSFTEGIGIIKECHITYNIVELGPAQWEVELVDGS